MMKAFNAAARVVAIFMAAVVIRVAYWKAGWAGVACVICGAAVVAMLWSASPADDADDKDENMRLKLEMIKDPTNMIVHMEDAPLREQMALISTASFCLLQILEQKTGKELTEDFINNIRAAKGAIIAGKLDKLKIDMIKQD